MKKYERMKRVEELHNKGMTQRKIAQEFGVSQATIAGDLRLLKEQGKIIQIKSSVLERGILERRKKVKELYNEGKTQKEITQELGVSHATIAGDIRYLKERGEISQVKDTVLERRKLKRRKRVKELYNQGMLQKEIVQKLGVSQQTISRDVRYLKEQGEISQVKDTVIERRKLERRKLERRKRVKELYNEGMTQRKIAQELSVSQATIAGDIRYLKEQRVKNKKDLEEKVEEYMSICKIKLKEGTLQREEIPKIEKAVSLTGKQEDMLFYIRACIKLGLIMKAKSKTALYSEVLTGEQQRKMIELKEETELIEKRYTAIKMLESESGVEEAAKTAGLSKAEVIELNQKLLKSKDKKNLKDENEDGEEPKL